MIIAMASMVMLTLIVGCVAAKARFAGVKNREVKASYFKLMQADNVPENITQSTRSFNNMFEVPVLFYVVCSLYVSLGLENGLASVLAWGFVASRCIHAYIHLTYNNVMHRMLVFWAGVLMVLGLWINLIYLH